MSAETTYPETKTRHRRRNDSTLLHMKNAGSTVEVWIRISAVEWTFGNDSTHIFTRPAGGVFSTLEEGWELDHSIFLPLDVQSAKDQGELVLLTHSLLS